MFGGGWEDGRGAAAGRFSARYRCYPMTFIDKQHLDHGDKVVLPPSALDRLASLSIDYPMLFQVTNPKVERRSHCGVMEFVADEGVVYLPYWMMENLCLTEGELVEFQSISLPKGSFVKLRPHTSDFLDISNPKAVLEYTLRNFTCLTVGDSIVVNYNNKKYYIDIIEAKPGEAISVVETDCEVDFAPPLDYKEPEKVFKKPEAPGAAPLPFAGVKIGRKKSLKDKKLKAPEPEPEPPKFQAFSGRGMSLSGAVVDGGPSSSSGPIAIPGAGAGGGGAGAGPMETGEGPPGLPRQGSFAGKPGSIGRKAAGKLVLGDGGTPPPAKKERKEEAAPEDAEPDFKAFSGKSYSLK